MASININTLCCKWGSLFWHFWRNPWLSIDWIWNLFTKMRYIRFCMIPQYMNEWSDISITNFFLKKILKNWTIFLWNEVFISTKVLFFKVYFLATSANLFVSFKYKLKILVSCKKFCFKLYEVWGKFSTSDIRS